MQTESGLIIPRPILTGEVPQPKQRKPLPTLEEIQKAQKEELYALCTQLIENLPEDLWEFAELPGSEAFNKDAEAVLAALFCKLENNLTSHFRKEKQTSEKEAFRRLGALANQIEAEKAKQDLSSLSRRQQILQARDREIRKATQQIKEQYAQALKDLETGKSEKIQALEEEDRQLKDQYLLEAELLAKKQTAYLSTLADIKAQFKLNY